MGDVGEPSQIHDDGPVIGGQAVEGEETADEDPQPGDELEIDKSQDTLRNIRREDTTEPRGDP